MCSETLQALGVLRTSTHGSLSRAVEQFATVSPDTFTQTAPSPNFKPLAVLRADHT